MTKPEIVAGALYDFLGFLTTRPKVITLSSHHEPHDVLDALEEWAAKRDLSLDEADVKHWHLQVASVKEAAPDGR